MKSKLKNIAISFLIMLIINIGFSSYVFLEMGIDSSHVGSLFVLGLVFGPYGALGATLGNILLDFMHGFTPMEILPSAIVSFGVSYLAYKLWYSGFRVDKLTKPKLTNINQLILFLSSIVACGLIYSAVHGGLMGIIIDPQLDEYTFISYFLNFINHAFIFGVIALWFSKRIDFIETPKISKKQYNKKLYRVLFILLLCITVITSLSLLLHRYGNLVMVEITAIIILLYAYLTKPINNEIQPNDENTITEQIIRNFLRITLTIAILGVILSFITHSYISDLDINVYLYLMPTLIVTDTIIILFFVPGIIILKYIESNMIQPVSSFSEIEGFIKENEKIEADGLLNIYSKYLDEKNEIGNLARSYTELIKHNNHYIENIHEIESEKERINAELNIATKIQAAALPTEGIENDDIIVDGYSHPAKEVGGDFFDYYMIDDENLAIIIGDASGKGVPAAIVAMNTQVIIKQMLKYDKNPSKILYLLNNQLSENNSQSMFLTLWLGIYNMKTKKLTFSNAGHSRPIIKENGKFKYLDIKPGIVLGVIEEFDYQIEEIILTDELIVYTDGITDANNEEEKMYGEDRLLNFFNEFKSDADPITPLLNDIHDFTGDAEQYDDMTLAFLKIK